MNSTPEREVKCPLTRALWSEFANFHKMWEEKQDLSLPLASMQVGGQGDANIGHF